MMISNLCLTLTDGLSLVACILSVISLIFITKINGILKKQSTDDSNQSQKNDFEKIKLLFDNLVQKKPSVFACFGWFLAQFSCDLTHTLSVHFLFSTTGRLALLYVLLDLLPELLWDYPTFVFF